MDTGQIIILVVYALGTLITAKYLRGKIKALKTQVDTQSGILSSVEKFMNIFDIQVVKDYVEIEKRTISLKAEEELKIIGDELTAAKKGLKSVAGLSEQLKNRIEALYDVIFKVSDTAIETSVMEREILSRDKSVEEKEAIKTMIAGKMSLEDGWKYLREVAKGGEEDFEKK